MLEIFGSILAGIVTAYGIFHWVRTERRVRHYGPVEDVGAGVYRVLERARDRQFRGSSDVRFTIFRPSADSPTELRAIARLGWGRPSAESSVRFQQGEGIAGYAWEDPGSLFLYSSGTEDGNPDELREAHKELFKLRPTNADLLSLDQLRAPTTIAASLMDCGKWFRGVLCIDCRVRGLIPTPAEPAWGRFWTEIADLATQLAAELPPAREPEVRLVELEPPRSFGTAEFAEVRLSG